MMLTTMSAIAILQMTVKIVRSIRKKRRNVAASRPDSGQLALMPVVAYGDIPMFWIICSSLRWMTGLNHAKKPLEMGGGGGS